MTYLFQRPRRAELHRWPRQIVRGGRWNLLLVAAGSRRPSVAEASSAVLSAAVDGFVVLRSRREDPHLQLVLQRHLPVAVVVDQPTDVPGFASQVGIDDRRAMQALADLLLVSLGQIVRSLCWR